MTVIRPATPSRRLKIRHVTTYTYDRPVTKSSHRIHLRPIHDWKQSVNTYSLSVTPQAEGGEVTEFEDVFGNFAARFDVTTPYTNLVLHAESEVEVLDLDPFDFVKRLQVRPTFPLECGLLWVHRSMAPGGCALTIDYFINVNMF